MEWFIGLNLLSVLFAYLLDVRFGEPNTPYHPVRLIGLLIENLERRFYNMEPKLYGGVLLLVLTVAVVVLAMCIILGIAKLLGVFIYFLISSLIMYFSISIKSMTDHAEAVFRPLSDGHIETAGQKLAMIVSRDTDGMDSEMIVRSCIESVSENFTDGVVSPIFYSVLFGGVGAVTFKAVSTLDSMVGYRNERYELFGRASAKADDLLNFIPARLSVLIISVAGFVRGVPFTKTFDVVKRFRLSHPSPNSAHSMSAFAGVLDVTLGGAVSYFGKVKEKPYIGDGKRELTPEIISEAVNLYKTSALTALLMACLPLMWMAL